MRNTGFDRPWTNDQLIGWFAYPVSTFGFFVLCDVFYDEKLAYVLVANSVLVCIVLSCWLYIEITDPSKPGGVPCWCMRKTQARSRYSAADRKTVPGLDHHCTWLNTAIGTRNYL
jgi:palmitoyltransferase